MNNKSIFVVIGIFLIAFICFHAYMINTKPPNKEDILLEKIIALETKLESLSRKQDSIKYLITNTEDSIIKNEKTHEEIANSILTNPDSVNQLFIDTYIKNYWKRYNSVGSNP